MSYKIYTTENCPWCKRAKLLVEALGHEDYEEIQEKHPDWPTYPAIVHEGNLIGGYTELAWKIRNS